LQMKLITLGHLLRWKGGQAKTARSASATTSDRVDTADVLHARESTSSHQVVAGCPRWLAVALFQICQRILAVQGKV
jgi:sarcosine oxidase delta subunit